MSAALVGTIAAHAARCEWWQVRAEYWARLGRHDMQAFCSKQAAYHAARC